jgi:hypothetical protein
MGEERADFYSGGHFSPDREPETLLLTILAFVAFSITASSVYLTTICSTSKLTGGMHTRSGAPLPQAICPS